jgi:hypothetical protein
MREVRGRRSASAAAAMVAFVAMSFLIGCEDQPRTIVMDDFESGAITG